MKVVLMLALALLATAPARAADLDDFLKRVEKLESTWGKAKPLCLCMDGSLGSDTRVGTLRVVETVSTDRRVQILCDVAVFHASTRNFTATAACLDYLVLGK
jgi:hypothetical protein